MICFPYLEHLQVCMKENICKFVPLFSDLKVLEVCAFLV